MKQKIKSALLICCTLGLTCIALLSITNPLAGSPPQDQTGNTLTTESGKSIYQAHCAPCHGMDGKGNGIVAGFLDPKPRDFTSGKYKFRSTESGSLPTDDDLMKTVSEGLHGTSMPDWKSYMGSDSLKAVIEYTKSFFPGFQTEKVKPVSVTSAIPSSEKSIADGKLVYEKMECAQCHGTDGTGINASGKDLVDDKGNPIKAANLTEPWTFKAGAKAQDIYLRLRTGIDGTPMPSYSGLATEKEMWDVANYIVSIARKPVWEMSEEEIRTLYSNQLQMQKNDPVARGKYLVESNGCADCHSPYNDDRSIMTELMFAGGSRWEIGPWGEVVSPNLTSDKETGIGTRTDEELKATITKGIRHDGSRMVPFPMPWTAFSGYSNEDLNAIIAYLRSIPPIYNKIPERSPKNFFSYLVAKFKMLILAEDLKLVIYPGNAGQTKKTSSANQKENTRTLSVLPSHQTGKENVQ